MFVKIYENNQLKKCRHELAQMVKNKELFVYSKKFDDYRGNIPTSCSYYDFHSFLDEIEADSEKKTYHSIPNNIIIRNISTYNKNKLNFFK